LFKKNREKSFENTIYQPDMVGTLLNCGGGKRTFSYY